MRTGGRFISSFEALALMMTRVNPKFRGGLMSLDGGTTWRPAAAWGDTAHTGASWTSRELASWQPLRGSADSDLLPDLDALVGRERDLARNNGIAQGAHQTKLDNVVGPTGLRLSSTPDYRALGKDRAWAEEWSNQVEALWRPWAETTMCDAAAKLNFAGLSRLVYAGGQLNGEAVALPLWMPEPRSAYALKLQVIESDRLATPVGQIDGRTMRGGVEVDDRGRPVAYWVRKAHPGDILFGFGSPLAYQWERIPAETAWGRKRVLHVHEVERAGQSRGKPDFTSVLMQFKMLDRYQRTEIEAAVVQAMVAAFIETPLDQQTLGNMLGGEVDQPPFQNYLAAKREHKVQFRGASMIPLFPGDKMTAFQPTRPNAVYGMFVENVLRHIGVGLNLPYELLMKDFSKTNYSSARASLLEAWRFFLGRRKWLSDYWASPVFALWLEEAVNARLIEAPDYYANQYAYTRCKWIGSGRGWVDPVKEIDAAGKRMLYNISSQEIECAEQGLDWEEVLDQISVERAYKQKLGIPQIEVVMSRQPQQTEQAVQDEQSGGQAPAAEAA
jgi:lambda family phage portal protein